MRSLNKLLWLRRIVLDLKRRWLVWRDGVNIHPGASISLSSTLIGGAPDAIVVDDGTLVAFKTLLVSRLPDGTIRPIRIGRNCFIGGGSTILPGVTIADECVVGAGSVVCHDVPPRCIVAGNPAKVLRTEIEVGRFGRFAYAEENQHLYYKQD